MKINYLLVLALFCSFNLFAQSNDSVLVVFDITDQDDIKIEDVRVTISQGASIVEVNSNILGKAECRVEKFGELKATFRHPDYSTSTIIEKIYPNSTLDTLYYRVVLTSISTLNLAEVIVTVPGVPTVIFGSKKLSVQDFEIVDQDNAILLTYPKQLKKGSKLLLYDLDNIVKDSIEIDGEAVELRRDYEGHIYLVMKDICKRIIINKNKIETIDISLYHYLRHIDPVVGVSKSKMFFSTYDQYYPAFDYVYLDVIDSTYTKFTSVIDREMMTEYRAEYRYVDMSDNDAVQLKLAAKNKELATGIDAEVLFGRKYFTGSIYYKAPFAPMFKMDDYLFLFNYHCDSLKTFDDNGKLLAGVGITHDHEKRKRGWQKLLLQDRIKNKVYVGYEIDGFHYLRRVNLSSGKLYAPIKLNHRYVENVQVYDGFIYYIYRPFESYQKKYFWREKLPRK
ncbi:MAG: hypothetical protein COA38_16190 [Fluviicola sp.]|nr:MAG: hypothetical protein COA38_16190 [Fluviicola sp.]